MGLFTKAVNIETSASDELTLTNSHNFFKKRANGYCHHFVSFNEKFIKPENNGILFYNLSLHIFGVFLPDSLVDLVKSLIIMQGNFPGVVCYKDPTVNMKRDSCDRHSSGSK